MAAANFGIACTRVGSATAIKLTGELDSGTCPELLERFYAILDEGASEVVVDLSEVSFIDSGGMRAIIVIERAAEERNIRLALRPPAGPVTELLEITGIREHIALTPSDDDTTPGAPFVERVELELAREPSTPGRARAEVRELVRGRLGETDSATITLLTSEVVTNSVIHPDPDAAGPILLRITAYTDRVRVEVSDTGSGFDPAALRPKPREAGGHGLFVVDGLSSRWGTRRVAGERGERGERFWVWFELDVAGGLAGVEAPAAAAGTSVTVAEG